MLEVHPYYLSRYAIWPYLPERYLYIALSVLNTAFLF